MNNSKSDIVIDLMEQMLTNDKFDAKITEELIYKTKPNKAPGLDGISINCIKSKLFVFLPLLLQLFNSIFNKKLSRKIGEFHY